jgi:patatin-like phospholipase/acyl hydrolase
MTTTAPNTATNTTSSPTRKPARKRSSGKALGRKTTWTILSINGGGIRGIIPATVLARIEQKTGRPISKLFKMIAGTSTGGILTAGLTLPNSCGEPAYTAQQMLDLYFSEGPTIFDKNLIREGWELFVTGGAKYLADGIESVLKKYFVDAKYKNQLCRTIIAAYEATQREAWFFKNWDADDGERDVAYVCRASSAAPTYFPPLQNGDDGCFIDGGVAANDPAVCALAEAILLAKPGDDFLLVSIGTGKYERPYTFKQLSGYRLWNWAGTILDILMDSQPQVANYQLQKILQIQMPEDRHELIRHALSRFFTFDTELDETTDAMDNADPANMQKLQALGNRIVDQEQTADFDAMCDRLLAILADEEAQVIADEAAREKARVERNKRRRKSSSKKTKCA